MHTLENSFDQVNRIRCFNHTMQLSVKALLRPFALIAGNDRGDLTDVVTVDDDMPDLEEIKDDEDEDDEGEGNDDNGLDLDGGREVEDEEKVDEEMDNLSEAEREALMDGTASVRSTIDKVFFLTTVMQNGH